MPQQDKRFLVQVFASDGTTFRDSFTTRKPADLTLPHIKNDITFRSRINGGLGECVLDIQVPWMDFDEGITIAINNIVDIYAIDQDNPRGRRIYRGFISKYEPYRSGSDQGVKVTCLGLVSLLMASYYKDGSAYAVTHTGVDPETVFRAIIDHFNTVNTNSLLSYTGASTDTVGTNVTLTLTDQRWGEAIAKTIALAGTDWWWSVDADGLCSFLAKPASATHTFTIGLDVESITAPKDGEKIVNKVQVRGESGATTDVSDATSITNYGIREKIVTDTSLADATTRTQRGNKEIGDNQVKIKSPFTVNANYDLESIKVGDTCRILNITGDSFFSTNMLIVAITYSGDSVKIEVEEENANLGSELRSMIDAQNQATNVSGGSGSSSSSSELGIVSKTSSFTSSDTYEIYECDATGGTIAVTLHSAATAAKKVYTVVKTDSSANAVTLPTLADSVDVSLLYQGQSAKIYPNGSVWRLLP